LQEVPTLVQEAFASIKTTLDPKWILNPGKLKIDFMLIIHFKRSVVGSKVQKCVHQAMQAIECALTIKRQMYLLLTYEFFSMLL
jgi:hypothetical protein